MIAELTQLHWESKWFFLLLVPLAGALALAWMRKPPTLIVGSLTSFKAASSGRRVASMIRLPLLFEVIGIALLIVALARPQHGIEEQRQRAEGIDIMLALDVSGSMQLIDPPEGVRKPANDAKTRIDVAKDEVSRFVDGRPNDRIGLLAFSGVTYTVCPPTLDHAFLKAQLNRPELTAGGLEDGTGIAAPISTAVADLKDSDARRTVTVLFTDGDNNVDIKISPRQAAKLAETFDVVVHTVGIGGTRPWVWQRDLFNRRRLVEIRDAGFDADLLRDIASLTKGRYFEARDADGLRQVMADIDAMETTTVEQPQYIDYKERYPKPLFMAVTILLFAFIAEHSVCLRVP